MNKKFLVNLLKREKTILLPGVVFFVLALESIGTLSLILCAINFTNSSVPCEYVLWCTNSIFAPLLCLIIFNKPCFADDEDSFLQFDEQDSLFSLKSFFLFIYLSFIKQ